jgi:hypothetical protein
VLVSDATVGNHVWKAIKRLVKLVTKAAGDKQLGIELGINFFNMYAVILYYERFCRRP